MSILNNYDKYCKWRDIVLNNTLDNINNCIVEVNNPLQLSIVERSQLINNCKKYNFSLFYLVNHNNYNSNLSAPITDNNAITTAIIKFNIQLGLDKYDDNLYAKSNGLSYITTSINKEQQEFIPYTNKAINWHTDGYYNNDDKCIRAFNLYCVQSSKNGGENWWFNHELAYILLREKDAKLAQILTNNQVFSIPEYRINNTINRAQFSGAVFSIDAKTNKLIMRYTKRKKNIVWNKHAIEAKKALDDILNTNSSNMFTHKIQAGQGLVCNNILHKRNAFTDTNNKRLMLRGRYFQRITNFDAGLLINLV